jgi:transposase-like protein
MVLIAVTCPYCQSDHITKRGKTETDKQRYRCHNPHCPHQSFLLHPAYKGRVPVIKAQIIDMALNGSGIRDTARVLGISTDTVLNELKKRIDTDLGQSVPARPFVAWRYRSRHPSRRRSRSRRNQTPPNYVVAPIPAG